MITILWDLTQGIETSEDRKYIYKLHI